MRRPTALKSIIVLVSMTSFVIIGVTDFLNHGPSRLDWIGPNQAFGAKSDKVPGPEPDPAPTLITGCFGPDRHSVIEFESACDIAASE